MNCLKSCGCLLLAGAALSPMFAGVQYVTSDCDIHELGIPETTTDLRFHQNGATRECTYTLSGDTTINVPAYAWPYNGASLVFDFTSGGYTLYLKGNGSWGAEPGREASSDARDRVSYLGGVWDLGGVNNYYAVGRGSGSGANYRALDVLLDGSAFTNFQDAYLVSNVADGHLVLTNGASISANGVGYFYLSYNNGNEYYAAGSTLDVMGGSRLVCKGDGHFDYAYSPIAALSDFKARFSGSGTFYRCDSATVIGGYMGGIEVRFDDHASGSSYQTYIGNGTYAQQARLLLFGGASFTNESQLIVGSVAGADRCRVEVTGGSGLHVVSPGGGTFSKVLVGSGSSCNELLISNSTLRAADVVLGSSTSSNNVVHIIGQASKWESHPLTNGKYLPFNGTGNTLVLDDCTIDHSSIEYQLYDATNSMLRIENGANVKVSSIAVGYRGSQYVASRASEGTKILVGADSTLEANVQFNVCGRDSVVCLSNGTLKADNQYSFYFGMADATYTKHAVTNNLFVFEGSHPRLRSDSAQSTFFFDGTSRIRFDLPPDGVYEDVPLRGHAISFNPNVRFEIGGLEEVQGRLERTSEIVLVQSDGTAITVYPASLNALNETLPKGCRMYLSKDKTKLILRARATNCGLMLIFR